MLSESVEGILLRGVTEEQLGNIAGKSLLSVWKQIERVEVEMREEGFLLHENVWEDRTWWRYYGYYQMPGPDPEDELGLGWYGPSSSEKGALFARRNIVKRKRQKKLR